MAELITGRTLFPGNDHIDQLNKIMKLVGTPSEDFIARISSEEAKRYIHSLPQTPKKDFREYFITPSDDGERYMLLLTEPLEFVWNCVYSIS